MWVVAWKEPDKIDVLFQTVLKLVIRTHLTFDQVFSSSAVWLICSDLCKFFVQDLKGAFLNKWITLKVLEIY